MSLEKDIVQRAFENEHQKALVNIIYTYNHLIGHLNTVFKDFDITRQQYNVLRILRGQAPKPASINLIKERMLDKMSDASRIVDRLRAKGFVERSKNKQDKRSAEISITKSGLATLATIHEKSDNFSYLMEGLSPEEAKILNSLLDKLRIGEKTQ